jgi:hypothetical protein
MVGVARVMGAEHRVVVLAGGRRRTEAGVLRDVVRPSHADEPSGLEHGLTVVRPERLDEGRDVVGIAGDDLDETVFPGNERLLVDPDREGLSEPELAALRDVPVGAVDRLVELLVLVARGRAVDDDGRALERFARIEGDLVAERLEVFGLVGVHGEVSAAAHQVVDFGALRRHRRPLVEGDLVDSEVALEVGEEADQRLADRAGSDDVYDLAHGRLSRISISAVEELPRTGTTRRIR